MQTLKFICLLFIGLTFFIGCSGNNANLKNLSQGESRAIQQELLDNWSGYDISYNDVVIVFDPRDDDKKILVYNFWSTIKDQESMTQLVNGTNKPPNRRINLVWGEPIREIWVHDQFYGYVSHRERELVNAPIIDKNTVRLIHTRNGLPYEQ